jgi:hypothetical protein
MAEEYIKGMAQLRARLQAVGASATHTKILTAGAGAVIREQKLLASRFRRTSFLEHSIQITDASPTSVTIKSLAPYSRYVEEGTGIYGPKHAKITPTAKMALAFHSQKAGAERFGIKYRLTGAMTAASARQYGGTNADMVVVASVKGRPATPYFFPGAQIGIQKTGGDLAAVIVKAWDEAK